MSVSDTGSLREDLERAAADVAAGDSAGPDGGEAAPDRGLTEDAPILTPESDKAPGTEVKPDRARDPKTGQFAEKAKETKPKAPEKTATVVELKPKLGEAPKPAETALKPAAPTPPASKPPASWRPEARETWAALPPAAQQEIARREKEIATTLQQAAPLRQEVDGWRQVLHPHQGMLTAYGADPRQTVGNLLQAQSVLLYGAPQQKAALIARLAHGYNVSPDDLGNAWNALSAGGTPAPQPQQFRDPRLDQWIAAAQQQKATREAQLDSEAQETWSSFAEGHEFAEPLKALIGVLLGSGQAKDLDSAYNMALRAHPDYHKVMQQREAAAQATAQEAATQAKKTAALSLKTVPGGTAVPDGERQPGSVGDDLRYMASRLSR